MVSDFRMLKYLVCCLARRGRHDYQLRRGPDTLFLECIRCGRRSRGWNVLPNRFKRAAEPLRLALAELTESVNPVLAALDKPGARAWVRRDMPVGTLRLTLALERRLRKRRQKLMKSPERRIRDRRRL